MNHSTVRASIEAALHTRRHFLRTALTATAGAAGVVACGGSDDEPSAPKLTAEAARRAVSQGLVGVADAR